MHCVNLSSAIRLYRGDIYEVFAHPYKYEPQPKFRYTRSFNRTLALVKTARQTVADYGIPTLILTRKHNCIDIVKFVIIASNLGIRTTSIMKYTFAPYEFGALDIGMRDLMQPSIGEKMWIWEVDEIDECAVKAFVEENGIKAIFFNDLDIEPQKKRFGKEGN